MILLLFTYVFGEAIYGSTTQYLQFMLPGLMVQSTMISSLTTAVGLNADLSNGVYNRLRSLPIARWSPLAGQILSETARHTLAITVLFVVAMVMGYRFQGPVVGVLAAYAVLLIFSLAVSWMAVLVGVLVNRPEKVTIYGVVITFPFTFTSSAFVPLEKMSALRVWAGVNPVTVVADAVRALLAGTPAAALVAGSVVWALGITAVFAPWAATALHRRV